MRTTLTCQSCVPVRKEKEGRVAEAVAATPGERETKRGQHPFKTGVPVHEHRPMHHRYTGTASRHSRHSTARRHRTQAPHAGTARRHSTQAQHAGTTHRHSTQAQLTGTAYTGTAYTGTAYTGTAYTGTAHRIKGTQDQRHTGT